MRDARDNQADMDDIDMDIDDEVGRDTVPFRVPADKGTGRSQRL